MTAKKAVAKRPATKKVATRKAAAKMPVPQSVHPGQMIQAVMANPDVDLDKVAKLFKLQEKFEASQAKKAYHAAMADFQASVPQITYDSWVNYANRDGKRTDFAFASLAGILIKIEGAMMDCGLNATWRTQNVDGGVEVTCVITHALGHSESTTLSAAADQSGGKNSIQAVKSTVSYLRRITLEAMLGLAAKGEDDDGQGNDEPEGLPALPNNWFEKNKAEAEKRIHEGKGTAAELIAKLATKYTLNPEQVQVINNMEIVNENA